MPLPRFVTQELASFVDCGVLARGLAVFKCQGACKERIVVALSCKGSGFCPRCLGRRMAATSVAQLTEPEALQRLLRHLGEPIDPPTLAPDRQPDPRLLT